MHSYQIIPEHTFMNLRVMHVTGKNWRSLEDLNRSNTERIKLILYNNLQFFLVVSSKESDR